MDITTLTTQQLLDSYQQIRTNKEKLDAEAAAAVKPFKDAMAKINMEVHRRLIEDGLQNTSNGTMTAFLKDSEDAGVEDWELALDFIVEGEHWDFIERRISLSALKAYMEQHGGELPPGMRYRCEKVCIIRRK